MRDAILACIRAHDGATFVVLCREVPGFAGNLEIAAPGAPNVIFWRGVSAEAIAALEDLRRDQKIHMQEARWSRYFADGRVLALPLVVVDRGENPGEPSWLPVLYLEGPFVRR